jgi:hypothetical protein
MDFNSDFNSVLKNMFDDDKLLKTASGISKSLCEMINNKNIDDLKMENINNDLNNILNLLETLTEEEKELVKCVYFMENDNEKLAKINLYNKIKEENLFDAFDRFIENITATNDEKDLLFNVLTSNPDDLHDIWYNYYFRDIIASEKADEELLNNISHSEKIAIAEMFQNNEDFQTELLETFKLTSESCKKMFEDIERELKNSSNTDQTL